MKENKNMGMELSEEELAGVTGGIGEKECIKQTGCYWFAGQGGHCICNDHV